MIENHILMYKDLNSRIAVFEFVIIRYDLFVSCVTTNRIPIHLQLKFKHISGAATIYIGRNSTFQLTLVN
jgi:hypothetical protein